MSDLISRSQLLKEIETWGGCVEALHEYIQNMPTAYDADKVVEQLEERSMLSSSMGMVPLKEAIKIVKAGGNIELSEHSKSQGN